MTKTYRKAIGAQLPAGSDHLFGIGEKTNFDLTKEWFQLLSETAIPDTLLPLFYLIEAKEGLQGILPVLVPTRKSFAPHVSGFTTFYSTLFRPLLNDNVTSAELAKAIHLIVTDTHASVLRFNAMDPQHFSFTLLKAALSEAGLVSFDFFDFGNWYLQVHPMKWDDYLKILPGKLRNTLKRLGKKFDEAGGQFRIMTGRGGDLLQALDDYQKVYASSWKKPEPHPRFIPEFMQLCAEKGWLRMGVAYVDNEPAAIQFWLVLHGRACIYKVAYDEKYSAYSPGSLLTGHLMRHVIEVDGVEEVDYLIGDDAYKKQWMSHRRERWGIVAYNPRTIMGLWGLVLEAGKRLIKILLAHLRKTQIFSKKLT